MGSLIAARAVQGLGVGGLTALVQVVIASIVSPARARPLLRLHRRGVRARHGQRPAHRRRRSWTPRSAGAAASSSACRSPSLAFVVLQKTLHVPDDQARGQHRLPRRAADRRRRLGPADLGVAGRPQLRLGARSPRPGWSRSACCCSSRAVVTEMRAKEPIIPLRLFRDRTTSLATFASVMVGVAMFGSTVYLSQYFQIAHGMTPTHAGLMSIAMVGGLLVSSIAHRPDHQPDRALEAVPRRRHGARGRRAARCSARSTRPPAWCGSARSWRSSASASAPPCRTSCSRCRTTPPSATWARPARWSRSSARWAARSASPRSARCSATRSSPASRRASPALGVQPGGRRQQQRDPGHGHPAGAGARGLRGGLRRRHRPHVPDRRAVRRDRPGRGAVHPRGAAADHDRARGRGGRRALELRRAARSASVRCGPAAGAVPLLPDRARRPCAGTRRRAAARRGQQREQRQELGPERRSPATARAASRPGRRRPSRCR